jgi:hypothetical protein
MQAARVLLGGAVAVLVLAVVAAAALPGVVAEPREQVRAPGPIEVEELSVQPGNVSGATAELALQAQVAHHGNPTRNVSVRFRAIDAESGFVVAERRVSLGTLTDEGWHAANATLRVERSGGYVLEARLFQDDRPVDTVRREVSGMAALTPAYARTGVSFTEQGTVPTVLVGVESVQDNRTTLRVETSLTNEGDVVSEDLRTAVVVRQAESNVVAGRAETDVGQIRAGRTERATATVTVPSGYNYYVDVALYKDGVLVDSTRSVANLDPEQRISANVTETDVEFQVSDFEGESDGPPGQRRTTVEEEGAGGAVPGFGLGAGLAAVVVALAFVNFRRDIHE